MLVSVVRRLLIMRSHLPTISAVILTCLAIAMGFIMLVESGGNVHLVVIKEIIIAVAASLLALVWAVSLVAMEAARWIVAIQASDPDLQD